LPRRRPRAIIASWCFIALHEGPDGCLHLPQGVVRFPRELLAPAGFRPEDPDTWPHAAGRLELVDGRILHLPPCGDLQQLVRVGVVGLLFDWVRTHPEFVVGGNETGIMFGRDVRAADAAVWRHADAGPLTGEGLLPGFARRVGEFFGA
jgi:hypothetical protein